MAGKRAGPAALPPLGTTEPSVLLLELYPGHGLSIALKIVCGADKPDVVLQSATTGDATVVASRSPAPARW